MGYPNPRPASPPHHARGPNVPSGATPARPTGTRRRHRWGTHRVRTLTALGAALLLLTGSVLVSGNLFIKDVTGHIEREELLGPAGKTAADGGKTLDGPVDLLLLGVDARQSSGRDNVRADTIVIAHIPASHDKAYLVSIPRDTRVEVPPFPRSGYSGGMAKATEAFFHGAQNGAGWAGGAQLMAATLKKMTGVSFDGAAVIDFNGFKEVVDELGGVRMCVDQKVRSRHLVLVDGKPTYKSNAAGEGQPVVYTPGCQDMRGWQALDYSRQRYGLKKGDYDRQRHQQQLIKAIAKKATGAGVITDPLQVRRLVKAAGKNFVLDTGNSAITDLIRTLWDVNDDLVLLRTNDGSFNGDNRGGEDISKLSKQMFEAVKSDSLYEFVSQNPNVVISGQ